MGSNYQLHNMMSGADPSLLGQYRHSSMEWKRPCLNHTTALHYNTPVPPHSQPPIDSRHQSYGQNTHIIQAPVWNEYNTFVSNITPHTKETFLAGLFSQPELTESTTESPSSTQSLSARTSVDNLNNNFAEPIPNGYYNPIGHDIINTFNGGLGQTSTASTGFPMLSTDLQDSKLSMELANIPASNADNSEVESFTGLKLDPQAMLQYHHSNQHAVSHSSRPPEDQESAQVRFICNIRRESRWVPISPVNEIRRRLVKEANTKNKVAEFDIDETLNLFQTKHVMKKLNILNLLHQANKSSTSSSTPAIDYEELKIPKLYVKDRCGQNNDEPSLQLMIHTSYGVDEIYQDDCLLKKFRHFKLMQNLLARDESSYCEEYAKNEKPKRPLNTWFIYRTCMTRAAAILKLVEVIPTDDFTQLEELEQDLKTDSKSHPEIKLNPDARIENNVVSGVISLLWATENEDIKLIFKDFADTEEKDLHSKVFPGYKYDPQRPGKLNSRKRLHGL